MKHLRTIKRRDLGRLVYKYSRKARMFRIDINFAYGKGNVEYFKRCPFNYLLINDPVKVGSLWLLDEENKKFIPANPACCGFSSNPILDLIKSELERKTE